MALIVHDQILDFRIGRFLDLHAHAEDRAGTVLVLVEELLGRGAVLLVGELLGLLVDGQQHIRRFEQFHRPFGRVETTLHGVAVGIDQQRLDVALSIENHIGHFPDLGVLARDHVVAQ